MMRLTTIGLLGADPDTANSMFHFKIAPVLRQGMERTQWIHVYAAQGFAKTVALLHKGTAVYVSGRCDFRVTAYGNENFVRVSLFASDLLITSSPRSNEGEPVKETPCSSSTDQEPASVAVPF